MKSAKQTNPAHRPKIVVVSNNYPSKYSLNRGAFVYNLVQQFADCFDVTVIAPLKINELFVRKTGKYGAEKCTVFRPIYPSLSNKKILGVDFGRVSFYFQKLAVVFTLKFMIRRPVSLVYAHFVINGLTAYDYSKKRKIPMILASGESSYIQVKSFSKQYLMDYLNSLRKIICVSDVNKSFFLQNNIEKNKLVVVPNAVNYDLFKPLGQKDKYKDALNIRQGSFVIGFVGHFIERKGANRLISAVDMLEDPEIIVVCIGNGPQKLLEREFVVEMAPVSNVVLPSLLNAFDIFVLPTLAEGHCNIIEEAKACCIPVISSIGTTVEKQISDKTGLLVDPMNIGDIASAIRELKTNVKRRREIIDNLEKERGVFSIRERAEEIMRYFK